MGAGPNGRQPVHVLENALEMTLPPSRAKTMSRFGPSDAAPGPELGSPPRRAQGAQLPVLVHDLIHIAPSPPRAKMSRRFASQVVAATPELSEPPRAMKPLHPVAAVQYCW